MSKTDCCTNADRASCLLLGTFGFPMPTGLNDCVVVDFWGAIALPLDLWGGAIGFERSEIIGF